MTPVIGEDVILVVAALYCGAHVDQGEWAVAVRNDIRGTRMQVVALAVVMSLSLASCGGDSGKDAGASGKDKGTPEAKVEVSVPDGAKDVATDGGLTVKAVGGELMSVTVTRSDGKATLAGTIAENKTGWSSTGLLHPKATYNVEAKAKNSAGQETSTKSSFTTVTPKKSIGYTVFPDGHKVGAGAPVQVKFKAPISSPKVRAAIEEQLQVTSTPAQPGAWGWVNNATLMYRPQAYWAAGTKVEVKAPLAGIQVTPGTYLTEDNGASMTVGPQRVMKVDLAKHQMTLHEDGQLVKSFAISGGRAGQRFETRGGTKVIQDKHADIVMDSSTFGIGKNDPEYYRNEVKWALRITQSGEFLHAAPWSLQDQGKRNVSHGCVNMAPNEAQWLFQRVVSGDIVETVNSNIPLKPDEAGIPVWLWTWEQWQKKSAKTAAAAAEAQ